MPIQRQRELFPSPLNHFLNEALKKRKNKNPRYSMRAFARDLNISASRLSEIFSGKSSPGPLLTKKMVHSLNLPFSEAQLLGNMIAKHKELHKKTKGARILREDEYAVIADLEHYAIFSLLNLVDFKFDPRWIAARLGLELEKVIMAISRLHRLGLIKVTVKKIIAVQTKVTTTHDIPSNILRQSHRMILEHAMMSLERDSVEDRDITSITLALNKERLPEAKALIKDFRRKLATLLETGPVNEVYNLNIQLVPLTVPLKGDPHEDV